MTETGIDASHTYAEEGTFNGSVSYTNDCGSHKVHFQANIADAPLSATGVAVSGAAGVNLNATVAKFTDADPAGVAADYTASIDWGDGSVTAGAISAAAGGGFAVTGSHTYASGGVYTTSVTISDVGGAEATASSSANVVGPPVVSNVSVVSVTETTGKIAFKIDPAGADTTYVIEYGHTTSYGQKTAPVDIGETRGAQSLTRTLTGLNPGSTYHFNVLATNSVAPKGVGGGDQSFTTSADAPLSATGVAVSGAAGVKLSATVAKFTDADPAGVAADYTASIDWGDGSTTAGTIGSAKGGGFAVTGSHTYASGGVYTTSVTISDVGGAKATASSSANVVGPPVVSNVSVVSVTETTSTVAFKIDPAGADTTYVIEYGPGTSYGQNTAPVDIGGTRGAQSLTRTLTGLNPGSTYHFNVLATNSVAPKGVGGGDQSFTTSADAPLSATGVAVSGTAGVKLSATVAKFTDADPAGVAADYTASIDWGDGSTTAGTIGSAKGGGFAVTGSHTYASGGVYTTSVTISDVGGAKATASSSANVVGPPVVSNVSVVSVTETTSTVAFEIDPAGADTTYVIEYGPGTSYGQNTAPVDIGGTRGAQSLTRTLTGLNPGSTYHFNVLATNSVAPTGVGAGDQPFTTVQQPGGGGGSSSNANVLKGTPPGSGVLGYQGTKAAVTPADLPPPVLGKSVNVTPVSGVVFIKLPPGAKLASFAPFSPFSLVTRAFAALTKGQGFVPLTEARQIPVGSTLDTTAGVVNITTATTASANGKLQSGDFGAGIFKLLQGRRQRGLTELSIVDAHSARQVCATAGKARAAARSVSSKVLGRLNSNAHGRFTARGQYSAATVRGTVWSVTNRCDGTLTKVNRGVVLVRDFRRRKTITLFTGQTYLARAPFTRVPFRRR